MNLRDAFANYAREVAREDYPAAIAIMSAVRDDPETPAEVIRESVMPRLAACRARLPRTLWERITGRIAQGGLN